MVLGEKLRNAMESLRKATVFDRNTVKDAVKEIQRALIAGDVEISLVLDLSKKIEEAALKEKLPKGLTRREHVLKVSYDSLVWLIEGKGKKAPEKPKKILLVGLYGQGKTTTTVKIAKYYMKRGLNVGVVCADSFRPAAFEQLQQLSEKVRVPFYGNQKEKNAAKIVEGALKEFKGRDLVIVDSAGRDALNKGLVKEIKEIDKALKAEEKWLVIGADVGQLAKKQAQAFHEAVGVNGVVITRMDGSAKGGGALTACNETEASVYFIGVGEKLDDLEVFDADRYLSRIMGYGDLQALLEKAKEISVEELSPEELLMQEFNLEIFYKQLEASRKMGPLNKVAEMMGIKTQLPKEVLEMTEEKLDKFKVIMDSMAPKEKQNPDVLNKSRIVRIAKGSGTTEKDVRELLKQYKQMQKVFKKFRKLDERKFERMAKKGKGLDLASMMKGFGMGKKVKRRKHFK